MFTDYGQKRVKWITFSMKTWSLLRALSLEIEIESRERVQMKLCNNFVWMVRKQTKRKMCRKKKPIMICTCSTSFRWWVACANRENENTLILNAFSAPICTFCFGCVIRIVYLISFLNEMPTLQTDTLHFITEIPLSISLCCAQHFYSNEL